MESAYHGIHPDFSDLDPLRCPHIDVTAFQIHPGPKFLSALLWLFKKPLTAIPHIAIRHRYDPLRGASNCVTLHLNRFGGIFDGDGRIPDVTADQRRIGVD